MGERKNIKKWIWIPILLVLITLLTIGAVVFKTARVDASESLFNLSERDVVLEVGESKQVKLELDEEEINKSKIKVSWESSKPSVANVDEDGNITATSGGETKITAIVEYKGHEYSTSCVITVKSADKEYSTYRIRWYTQKKDRTGYEIVEESYERLVGSSVELTVADAKKKLPGNYTLNTEKSILTGKVKEQVNGCVLAVYFDVAQIQYSVDYYYESATALGTYKEKETKKYTAYAFTKVAVTGGQKTGFVINDKVSGTVLSKDSVVSGTKLKVFCDRIRSKVTVNYISGKASATYDCIYGIGLINAPADVFSDTSKYKIATYINGEKKAATAETMKTVAKDTTVQLGVDGVGFEISKDIITNNCSEKATPCYAVLNGSSDTIHLSATYVTTGSSSNTFGITLSSGGTSREIRFSKMGVAIMKDNTTSGGVLTASAKRNAYREAGVYNDGETFVWAQNSRGSRNDTAIKNSVVQNMMQNIEGGSYDIKWAVLDGVLYCRIEDQTVLRLPLTYLESTWTADKEYEIGFSSYDENAWSDSLQVKNVSLTLGDAAKAILVTDKEVEMEEVLNMAYDPFTGNYLPGSQSGAAYMYGETTAENTGVATTVKWVDKDNTVSAIGVTLKMGEETIQYVVEGMNSTIRSQTDHSWKNVIKITNQVLSEATPFTDAGVTEVKAFVKDGYFYIMYNGEVGNCINMLSLFPEYTLESEVSVGICTWDAGYGLAEFSDVTELTANDIEAIDAQEWGFYSQELSVNAYDFTEDEEAERTTGSVSKTAKGANTTTLMGTNKTWQIAGNFERYDDTKADLLMGFTISSGDNNVMILGRLNGFQKVINGVWQNKDETCRDYSDNPSTSKYAFNTIVSDKFFNKNDAGTRTQEVLGFKAVLYNDVLYVWFTDEEGNTGLCWRIPLTEEQFGGFEAGSSYEIQLYMSNSDTQGAITGLDVKMGYQVTSQEAFITDNADKVYNFSDAIATIDANISRWDKFQHKTIAGNLAEELDSYRLTKDAPYAYLQGTDTDIFLSATYEIDKKAEFFGVILKGDNGEQRSIIYNNSGVSMIQNNSWKWSDIPAISSVKNATHNYYNQERGGYIWVQSTSNTPKSPVEAMTSNLASDKTYDVKWALTDGVLYGMVDGFVFYRMPVNKLCADWNEETKFQIGFGQWDSTNNGDIAITKNIEVSYGESALAKMVKDKTLVASAVSGMEYEVFNGTYLPHSSGGTKYLYGVATNETQVLKTTIKSIEGVNTASHGISVKAGDKSVQIAVQPNNGKVRLLFNHAWDVIEVTSWVDSSITKYNADGVCNVMAVLKDGTLYLYYHEQLVCSFDIYKLIPGYTEGDKVQLGIASRDPKFGLVTFSNTTFATGDAALEGITLSNDKEWEFFTLTDGVLTSTGTNMTGDNVTHVVTPTAGKSGAEYIYGVSTNMPQMMTTKITLANYANLTSSSAYSSNGITIESGGESVQFVIEGIKQQIRIINNYKWNPCVRENIATAYKAYDENGVYNITAIVKNDTLYLVYNENVSYQIALDKLFNNYQSGDKVRLGLFSWDQKTNASTFSDVTFNAGAKATFDASAIKTAIEYLTKYNYKNYFQVINGVASKTAAATSDKNTAYMLFKGESTTWEVSGTISRTDVIYGKDFLAGFYIEQGSKYFSVVAAKAGASFIGTSWNNDYRTTGNKWIMNAPTDTSMFNSTYNANSDKSVDFKAIISEDILYVWLDGVPCWRVDLTEKNAKANGTVVFTGFEADKPYSFGFRICSNGSAKTNGSFSNLSVKKGNVDTAAVEAFETAYQEYVKTLD